MMGVAKKITPAKELLKVIEGVKSIYIVIYGTVDPDSVGSAWALKELLKAKGVSSEIGFTGEIGRLENEAMILALRMPVAPVDREALDRAEKVAIVDAQLEFFKDYDLPRCDIVIDHHPRKSDKTTPFSDIRPKCLSAASMLTEYLLELKIPIHKRLATALYHGIQVDSKGLRRSGTPVDRMAKEHLEGLADHSLLRRVELSQYSLGGLDYFSIALAKRRYAKNRLYAHLGSLSTADICAQVADFLIRVNEVYWAIVSGVVNDKLVIVFRCDGRTQNAGKLAQEAFGEIGSAGGHKTMGRAEIEQKALDNLTLTHNEKCEHFLIGLLARVDRTFIALAKVLPHEGLGGTL